MHGLCACFNHATQVFSLDVLCCLMRCIYLRTLSEGKQTNLKSLSMAHSWIDAEIMIMMLQRTHCLQELDMSDVSHLQSHNKVHFPFF